MCESVSCCSAACDLDGFGILVFGPQTRNLHPGGSARGGLESGGWQCRGPEGRGDRDEERGGVRMGCPSLLPLSLPPLLSLFLFPSLPPSLCMCSAAPAVGLPTHSLRVTQAGVEGTTSVRPAQPGRPQPAGGNTGQRDAVTHKRTHPERFAVSLL